MGQSYRHDDDQTTDAGRAAYSAILECRRDGIPDEKIIVAFMAEIYSLAEEALRAKK